MARQRELVTFHCNGKPYRLQYRHSDLRLAAEATGKSIVQLFDDPLAGVPYLLLAGLKKQFPRGTVADADQLIDDWMADGKEMKELQNLILDALTEAGYLKKTDDASDSEGNAPSPTPIP